MTTEAISPADSADPTYSLAGLVGYAARLGTIDFGGPVALVGYMHRDLVEQRGWFGDPGPRCSCAHYPRR